MSTESLTQGERAYWHNDLRGEINLVYNRNRTLYQGRESEGPIVLPGHDIGVRLPEDAQRKLNKFSCRMPWEVFDDFVDHEKRFGKCSRLAEDDRQLSGADLLRDNSWPFCRDCLLPFVTILNGHPGQGCWVSRIDDGDELCECCWLAEHYAGDRAQMIRHVLAHDMGDDSRLIRVEMRRDRIDWAAAPLSLTRSDHLGTAVLHLERDAWHSPGLRELIRLHRVSLTECAEVIVRMVKDLVKKVRCEDREKNLRVSNSLNSGTRAACYA